jgi:N-formylglutamate deformylase
MDRRPSTWSEPTLEPNHSFTTGAELLKDYKEAVMALFHLTVGEGPIVATAIHHGHDVRPNVASLLAIADDHRLREEDPYTGNLASLAPTHIISHRSRFEFDLNRPRDGAVYLTSEAAWGVNIWRQLPDEAVVAESLASYDLFYATVHTLLDQLVQRFGRIVVLDLHSYNHRRDGASGQPASIAENPEINLGTASVNRDIWGLLVDCFASDLRKQIGNERPFDVRENIKFQGGHFPRWINGAFSGRVCAIAVEFKKTFMDEWTGELERPFFSKLQATLAATFPGLLDSLSHLSVDS